MATQNSQQAAASDIVVIGAGLAGSAAAIGLAQAGFSVLSCGPSDVARNGRTVALFGRSIELLKRLGVWERVEASGEALRVLRIVDDTGSLFSPRPVEFEAREIGLEAFGWNIENSLLGEILDERLQAAAGVRRIRTPVVGYEFGGDVARLTLADGAEIPAALVVGADGRASPTRKAAGLDATLHRYGQTAMTLIMAHSRPHDDVSTEFHTREGPFTLVPLPPARDGRYRSSLVWLMSDARARRLSALSTAELAQAVGVQSRNLLGAIEIEDGRGQFPMTRMFVARVSAPRVALVGDAAHAFPPIGAQGLNLGLRDVEDLIAAVSDARVAGRDIGGVEALADYQRRRAPDIRTRMLAVNALNMTLLADLAPVNAMRGAGLSVLRRLAPLRRLVMREGMEPHLSR